MKTKPQKRHTTPLLLTFALLLALVAAGCGPKRDSPAPGCAGSGGFGGCAGKTVILDLQVENAPACLTIRVNNCNGGILDVNNQCDEAAILGGPEALPNTAN